MGHSPLYRFTRIKHPVARDEDLLIEELADETVVYHLETKEAHCLKPLAAVVFAHCDGRTTVDQLAALATERLGEPVDEPRVIDALAQLQERDLLAVPPRGGFSRREMIGKSAAVAGGAFVGTSLITSIMAPPAVAALTTSCGAVLCCPCCTNTNFNKEECCVGASDQCVCVENRTINPDGSAGTPGQTKWCTPVGVSQVNDAFCQTYDENVCPDVDECTDCPRGNPNP